MAVGGTDSPQAAHDRPARILIFLVIVSLAFNDLDPLLPVGELSSDAYVYVFPLLLLYVLRRPESVAAPVSLALFILAFGMTLLIGVGLNHEAISSAYFKGRSGIGRVTTQGLTLGLGLITTLVFYNLTARGFLPVISRAARIALMVMAAVGMFEFASWFELPGFSQIHAGLSAMVHADSDAEYPERLRMTAFEVSWTGVMLTFFFPFAMIGARPGSWRMPTYIALVLLMTIMTRARTAFLAVGFQILLMIWMLLRRRADLVVHTLTAGSIAAVLLFLTPTVQDRAATVVSNMIRYGSPTIPHDDLGEENVSNVTRLAAIRAGTSMVRANPFFGIGLGQYGFNYPGHLQADDFRSWEVRKYAADAEEDWPPSYSIHSRLLAEAGIVGYAIWLALILAGLSRSLTNAGIGSEVDRAHLAVVMTLSGWLLLGISIDSFRFFGGWIAVGVAFALPSPPPQAS